MAADDFFDPHQLDLEGPLHLLQPVGDIAYGFLYVGDQDMLQGVDSTAGGLDLFGEKLDGLPQPAQFHQIL